MIDHLRSRDSAELASIDELLKEASEYEAKVESEEDTDLT